jgi:predicted transcriptional regulator
MARSTDIIKYLIENKETNINQVSTGLKLDYKNTHNLIKRLEEEEIISIKSFGKASQVTLSQKPHPLLFQAEHERRQSLSKDLKMIEEYFSRNLNTKFYVLLLFGSFAKKTHNKNSDIDLLFVIPNNASEEEIYRVVGMLPFKLHLNIFSEKEFLAMKNSKIPTVGSEAIKNNVIMHGIETYYELLK